MAAALPKVLESAHALLATGNYAILSFDALDSFYREGNDTDFTLTGELVGRCSFVSKGAFSLLDAAQFKAQIAAPQGVAQGRVGNDKRAGILEEIKLQKFLKMEQFLIDTERVFVSNDLIDDLTPSADKPCLTLALLSKCVFVSKRIFDPLIAGKQYQCDYNDGHENIVKFAKLSSAIRGLQGVREENLKAGDDEEPIDMLYILALKA